MSVLALIVLAMHKLLGGASHIRVSSVLDDLLILLHRVGNCHEVLRLGGHLGDRLRLSRLNHHIEGAVLGDLGHLAVETGFEVHIDFKLVNVIFNCCNINIKELIDITSSCD
jgi:hypothetical protein